MSLYSTSKTIIISTGYLLQDVFVENEGWDVDVDAEWRDEL